MFKRQIIPQIAYEKEIENLKFIHKQFFFNKLQIKNKKININKFFNFYKITIIYFFIGNFFIQNKLYKTFKNAIEIHENFIKISKKMTNISIYLYNFLYKIKKKNNLNMNNTLFLCNSLFYIPEDILNNFYFHFNILSIYLKNIKIIFNFFNIYLLKTLFILNNSCNSKNKFNSNIV